MAQLKNLLVNGPSKFLGPIMGKLVGGASFTQPVNFVDDNALPSKNLEFILGIDSFSNGGQVGWQNLSQVTVGNASNASQVPWSGVTNKPATFPPETHNHDTLYLKRAGDTLSSPLTVTGGDAANKGKIILDQANQGQITDTGTATLFGFTSSNALTIGSTSYTTNIRGSSVSINGKEVALKSDIPTIPNISASGSGPLTLSATGHTLTGSISVGTTGAVGVVKQHTSSDCTSYTSDEGATTPAAVKKAVGLFGDQWYSPIGHSHDYVTYATYLALQTTSNLAGQTNKLSTRASSWGGQAPSTVKSIPWRQAWVDSSISTDSGDMVLGLRPSEYASGGTELCMFIDGDYYAMGNKVLNTANYSTYLDNRYVTLDTAQTIGGAKTFTSARTTIHHKLQLTRSSSVTEGRLSFYDAGYNTWIEYMSNPAVGCCPTKGTPSTLGDVTSWARRSIIENSTGYGWIWEACANDHEGTPNPIMALSSNTGQMTLAGTTVALNSGSGKIQYNTTTKSIDFIFA